ncbi:FAD-binding oxidoreductase [Streptococcus parauberis]|uniref:FAD-binding oxidoreductase n=1 Tax=Streptococcus parauberis TaxID=1348 RepID=A0AAE4L3F4_9STRE|nr:FAD-binding oxidoreductase [Streptococcus parauberis]MDT2731383.1 FAD-binding oxidoreductase [Streptococcus parauberis]PIO78850.1 dihydroorotate dehydrogenase electron transfer subunit [Streptococcus parauberis]POS68059.1 dihydroorotate dehydrogenase electron transfer subunit [Streptococcus parauberis]
MLKKLTSHMGLSWMIILFIIPLPFMYTVKAGLSGVHANSSFGILLGVLAYVWMLTATYIATKPKWIDRWVGMPSAYMIHGMISLLAIFLAFFHKELDPSNGLIKNTGDIAFVIFLSLAAYSMIFMAGWLTSRVPLLESIKKLLEKIFKHEISVWLHRLNVLATLLVFIHIQLIDYIFAIKPFMLLIWIYSVFVFLSYLWFHFKPAAHGIQASLTSNYEIAPNIRELQVQLPRRSRLKFHPGDFAFISFPQIKGMAEPHPFSLVNVPGRDGLLTFAIRGDGDFTRQVAQVPNNSPIRVDGGFGKYQSLIKSFKPKEILIIGGGIGVVPLLSVAEGNPQIPTQFFYTVKSPEQFIYQDRLSQWQENPHFRAYCQVGRYNDQEILDHLPENPNDCIVLLGGPIAMGRHWQKVMQATGINPERVYFEEFSW